jgi:hypothetical protein
MYLLASGVLTLMRTMKDIGETREAPSGACQAEVQELADVLEELLDAPRPWPEAQVRDVASRMQELSARPSSGETPVSAIITTAARRVAGDIAGLLPRLPA